MFKRTTLTHALSHAAALALLMPGAALAEFEITGYLKNETSVYTQSGQTIGAESSNIDTNDTVSTGEVQKFENSARAFMNWDWGQTAWHGDVNLIYDTEGVNDYWKGYERFTSYDYLRELYTDFNTGPVYWRLGKQQVVWGTADGIKLLDIINPTDYRFFVQDTFEDSRIPVWMAKAEIDVGQNGNLQALISQHRQNIYPGLSPEKLGGRSIQYNNPFAGSPTDNSGLSGVDQGQPFLAQGTDSITGLVNGFYNITPALGGVAQTFNLGAIGGGSPIGLIPFAGATVQNFVDSPALQTAFGCGTGAVPSGGAACLNFYTQVTNQNITNLMPGNAYDAGNPTSAFEYFPNATFATFNTFANADSVYHTDYPSDGNPNFGLRWKGNTAGGFNYSLNYLYSYDVNPSVSLHWQSPTTGETLNVQKVSGAQYNALGVLPPGSDLTTQTVVLTDSAGNSYGAFDANPTSPTFGAQINRPAQLVFEETVHRIQNVGASFDTAFSTAVPIVLRGEFLYQKDVRVPIINRTELGIGNLTEGLKPEKADFFKYVLGVDVTVLTNLLVSGQFIQFINLDYEGGNDVYTGDPALLHLTNGLQKAKEYDNYFSLFLSKPFGEAQLGRINNIIIYEQKNGGGFWNRLDAEYSFSDSLIGTAEWNAYFGEKNTLFGQFDKSSNVQVGLKYIFE
jgi:hypothetical protein